MQQDTSRARLPTQERPLMTKEGPPFSSPSGASWEETARAKPRRGGAEEEEEEEEEAEAEQPVKSSTKTVEPEAVARKTGAEEGAEGEAAAAGLQARAVKGVEEAPAAKGAGASETAPPFPPLPPPRSLPRLDRFTSQALPSAVSSVRREAAAEAEEEGWKEAATNELAAAVVVVALPSSSEASTVAEGSVSPFSSSTSACRLTFDAEATASSEPSGEATTKAAVSFSSPPLSISSSASSAAERAVSGKGSGSRPSSTLVAAAISGPARKT